MKIKISLLLFFFSMLSFAQIKEVVLDTIAKQTCSCLKEKNQKIDVNDFKKFQMNAGLCILEKYQNNENLIDEKDRVSISDSDGLKKIGELVAMKMLIHCPDIILKLGEMSQSKNELAEDNEELAEEPKSIPMEGTLLDIKTEQFVTFIFKDSKNKIHTILLLDYFETAHLFRENKIKKNDKIKIDFAEYEMYDPKIKDFRNFKVLNYLEKIN